MGLLKESMLEEQERGWRDPQTFVCSRCVRDRYLQRLLRDEATRNRCDYCHRRSERPIAAPIAVLIEALFATLNEYYCEPGAGGVPYEQGYIVESIWFREVLDHLGFEGNEDLMDALVDAEVNGDGFVPAAGGDWSGIHPHEVLSSAWSSFAHAVKHETRFHFGKVPRSRHGSPYEIDIRDTLPAITAHLRPHVRTLRKGTLVYRARIRRPGDTWAPTADQLGAPEPRKARAGRMNPAGIPYLYTSLAPVTVLREVGLGPRSRRVVYTATFELTQPLLIVDLTQEPKFPSVFDIERKREREQAMFIRQFADAISAPVEKDGLEHVDYAPTQVVSEYLAQVFDAGGGRRLGGLLFPSAVHKGGKNLVVFPDHRLEPTFHGVEFVRASR